MRWIYWIAAFGFGFPMTGCAVTNAQSRTETLGDTQECRPIIGLDAVLDSAPRYLIIGEIHGTEEIPAVFAEIACGIAEQRDNIMVAVEYPERHSVSLQAFLASPGGASDRARLLASDFWTGPHDGRSSVAMLTLIERLRLMQQAGHIAGVAAAQPSNVSVDEDYEQAMANLWIKAGQAGHPVVALVGNVHAMTEKIAFGDGEPEPRAAYFLPADSRISLDTNFSGGSAWACFSPGECGPNKIGKQTGKAATGPSSPPSIALMPNDYYDGAVDLHVPIHPSPPAVEPYSETDP